MLVDTTLDNNSQFPSLVVRHLIRSVFGDVMAADVKDVSVIVDIVDADIGDVVLVVFSQAGRLQNQVGVKKAADCGAA